MTERRAVWWRAPFSGAVWLVQAAGWRGGDLDVDSIMAEAMRETGCTDFGDDEFLLPLACVISEFERCASADALGRQLFRGTLLQCLRNRLRIRAAMAADPTVAGRRIAGPLFVVGLPRTGSTLLQGLLGSVAGMRTLRRFETDLGSVLPHVASAREHDRLIRDARRQARFVNALSPRLRAIHEIGAELPEECNPLLMTSLRALFFMLLFDCPRYEDEVYASDFRGAYEWHKLHLQAITAPGDARTWVLKAPAHLASLRALLRIYPDACVVFTHRDPLAAVPSMASLGECLRMLASPRIDRHAIGRSLMRSLGRVHAAGEAARAAWPGRARPFLDIEYDALVRDPLDTVRGVLRHFAIDEGGDLAARLGPYLEAHRRHPRGAHRYDLVDYGLCADDIRASFGPECERAADRDSATASA